MPIEIGLDIGVGTAGIGAGHLFLFYADGSQVSYTSADAIQYG